METCTIALLLNFEEERALATLRWSRLLRTGGLDQLPTITTVLCCSLSVVAVPDSGFSLCVPLHYDWHAHMPFLTTLP